MAWKASWAGLTEELRQQRVKFLGPRSETLSDLQLELLADQEPGTTVDAVEAEAQRAPKRRRATGGHIRDGNACRRICRASRRWSAVRNKPAGTVVPKRR